jgi:hypothetical protein
MPCARELGHLDRCASLHEVECLGRRPANLPPRQPAAAAAAAATDDTPSSADSTHPLPTAAWSPQRWARFNRDYSPPPPSPSGGGGGGGGRGGGGGGSRRPAEGEPPDEGSAAAARYYMDLPDRRPAALEQRVDFRTFRRFAHHVRHAASQLAWRCLPESARAQLAPAAQHLGWEVRAGL